mmetsp:Transcript_17543/g.50214  ORF Transcript_17543/g.50214 Transcript_17543/m.50214 type:complete len:249 (-) Transcript_17543:150-896(-)
MWRLWECVTLLGLVLRPLLLPQVAIRSKRPIRLSPLRRPRSLMRATHSLPLLRLGLPSCSLTQLEGLTTHPPCKTPRSLALGCLPPRRPGHMVSRLHPPPAPDSSTLSPCRPSLLHRLLIPSVRRHRSLPSVPALVPLSRPRNLLMILSASSRHLLLQFQPPLLPPAPFPSQLLRPPHRVIRGPIWGSDLPFPTRATRLGSPLLRLPAHSRETPAKEWVALSLLIEPLESCLLAANGTMLASLPPPLE